jgi:hypothetical protein
MSLVICHSRSGMSHVMCHLRRGMSLRYVTDKRLNITSCANRGLIILCLNEMLLRYLYG